MNFSRKAGIQLVRDREHYDNVVMKTIRTAQVSVWIATANLKEMWVEAPIGTRARARGRYISILDVFADLAARGVDVRILHAGNPSQAFETTFAKLRSKLRSHFELRRCPRVHLKVIAVDGHALYIGSANFTGAGLGAKGDGRRNFELGILTDDDVLLDQVQARFERIWNGAECKNCSIRDLCPRPLDISTRLRLPVAPTEAAAPRRKPKRVAASKKARRVANLRDENSAQKKTKRASKV